jgi:hypothetical protein
MNNEQALEEIVQNSSLHTCLMLVAKVLTRNGFGDIQILDRRMPRQKSRLGGCELLCVTSIGSVSVRVIIKVIRDSVRTRMLDELAGAIDRTGSDFGILVSNKRLPKGMSARHEMYVKSRVEVIDLALLVQMLVKFRVGVRPAGEPDYAFFVDLEEKLDQVNDFLSYGRFTR